jgi:23S rRNA (guanine2445-N2)-methyltransferase / 23S rRNA (guanine2069-N7)-methyltransferase
MNLQLIATCAFGLEAVVAHELRALGYESKTVRPGRLTFTGDAAAVARTNLWLRSADRVLIELAAFPAPDFDALFDTVRDLPWADWIAADAAIPVRGRSLKSQLTSVPAIQRSVKKAIVESLLAARPGVELPEIGAPVPVEISIVENAATIDLDTSGEGLHKRGYRTLAAEAQIRETLAAAMVQLSFWRPERPFVDPFCGTGTIAIEAALIGRRMAPGRNRTFAAEEWGAIPSAVWTAALEEADDLVLPTLPERVIGSDISGSTLKLARHHAELAGVAADVHFQQHDFAELSSSRRYGCLVTNPPYGLRMGEEVEVEALYRSFPVVLRRLKTWSHFILTARPDLQQLVGQQADKRRKLYNGRIACTLYQFFGPKPPRTPRADQAEDQSKELSGSIPLEGRAGEGGDQPDDAGDEQFVAETVSEAKPKPTRPDPIRGPAFGGLRDEAWRQAEEFGNRLKKLARHLRKWPTKRGITCYRLYERDIPEVPLVVDRYEDALHIAEFERPHERTPAEHADWLDHMVREAARALETPRELVFVKHRRRQRGAAQYEAVDDRRAMRVVNEGGLKFQVNLSDYVDTGLFLDHRITRGMVRDAAKGKSFLNLFAYTGSFTAYAAAGGAAQTTTVDLLPGHLDWAEENLRLNGLSGSQHRMVQADARDYLASLRGTWQFDLAVVDPPTFSNSKRMDDDWDVQQDHADLLAATLANLKPGGLLFFSTNSRKFKFDEAALSGASAREISKHTVPEDFRNKRIHRCWRIVKAGGEVASS